MLSTWRHFLVGFVFSIWTRKKKNEWTPPKRKRHVDAGRGSFYQSFCLPLCAIWVHIGVVLFQDLSWSIAQTTGEKAKGFLRVPNVGNWSCLSLRKYKLTRVSLYWRSGVPFFGTEMELLRHLEILMWVHVGGLHLFCPVKEVVRCRILMSQCRR